MAEEAAATYGVSRDVDPFTALLELVHGAAGHVQWLLLKVQTIEAEQLAWGMVSEELVRERAAEPAAGENGGLEIIPGSREQIERVVKRRISMASEVNVWLKLYNDERDRLASYCATAIKCGIAERVVRLNEDYAQMISTVFVKSLQDLGVDPYTEQARAALRKNLLLVAANGGASA